MADVCLSTFGFLKLSWPLTLVEGVRAVASCRGLDEVGGSHGMCFILLFSNDITLNNGSEVATDGSSRRETVSTVT